MAKSVAELLAAARAHGRRALNEHDGKQALASAGVAVPASRTLTPDPGQDEIAAAAAHLHAPLVLKLMSDSVLHKSDAGAVKLNLQSPQAVHAAVRAMRSDPRLAGDVVDGFLLEEMAPPGVEMVIGGVVDPQFGPMVMAGLGGIFVEVLQDVSFRLCPIHADDAAQMLDELRGAAVLDGVRGDQPADRQALVGALLAVGGEQGLMMRHGNDIAELDINPLIVSAHGAVAVDAAVVLSQTQSGHDFSVPRRPDPQVLEDMRALFEPRAIAVVGASATSTTIANTCIVRLKQFGFGGDIFPVHPKAESIESLPAVASLADVPRPVDYAYIAVAAERVPALLADGAGKLAYAQVVSSGFREVSGGEELEARLVAAAREAGTRVLGPNCLGLYSPRGGVAFWADAPVEPGAVGVLCQSGGLGTDIVKRGQFRGVKYSAVVTIGNCADLKPADYLEYFLLDPNTRVLGCYMEDVQNGRDFFDLLRHAPAGKPLLILLGGRSAAGRAAAASHTGALAGDGRSWQALCAQTVSAVVSTVDEFVDALLILQNCFSGDGARRVTNKVVLFGNGGGTSVLGTDSFAEQGLTVRAFEPAVRDKLEALGMPPGTSVVNPIDTPVGTLQTQEGFIARAILDIVYQHADVDAVVMHLNLAAFVARGNTNPVTNLVQVALETRRRFPQGPHFVMVLRSDGSKALDDARREFRSLVLEAGIAVYDELAQAAAALGVLSRVESAAARRG